MMADNNTDALDAGILRQRAEDMIAGLEARAGETEALRKLPPATIADIKAAGLHRICQPRRFGGAEAPLDVAVDIVATLARGCASTAWVVGVFADHSIIVGMMEPGCVDDIWATDRDATISAAFAPTGTGERVEGGWRISGRWGWSSGSDHADWYLLVTPLPDPANDGAIATYFCLVEREFVAVEDTWHVMGLAGTGSNDLIVADAFVPDYRAMPTKRAHEGAVARGRTDVAALYRLPHVSCVPFLLAAPSLGVAQAVLDSHVAYIGSHPSTRGTAVGELATMQMHVAEAAAEIDAARLLAQRHCREAMDAMAEGRTLTMAERARGRRDQAYVARLCQRAVDRLFTAGGGGVLSTKSEMQRRFRDMHAIAAHIALNWDISATTYGRVAFGLDPATPLV
jgi:alkylation response protein AidB-like acyl-CoA dehydrogenase